MPVAPICYDNVQAPKATGNAPTLPTIGQIRLGNTSGWPNGLSSTLQNIISAINSLAYGYQILSGQLAEALSEVNPGQSRGQQKQGTTLSTKPNKQTNPTIRFAETQRATTVVKVYNPDDPSQFIEVEQITSLTLTDKKTGETWTWTR